MAQREHLIEQIKAKNSFLCVGLDLDQTKFPDFLKKEYGQADVVGFAKRIIEQTHDLAVAYKPNRAFFEAMGLHGMYALEEIYKFLIDWFPDILIIDDAKRGDIGNTGKMYAKASFKLLGADAITVAPYMGKDSVKPFLDHKEKWTILLALTSNKGSEDFQMLQTPTGLSKHYEEVLTKASTWATPEQLMFVVGATKAEMLGEIRSIVPDNFLLVPGVGAQGGSLEEVIEFGMNKDCGLLVNSSRGILYAGNDHGFANAAREEALRMQEVMAKGLQDKGIV